MPLDSDRKAQTRRKVLGEAAAAIRSVGPGGIGVANLMKKAGLTHGGFYAHFKSKDDLVAQAISQMFDESHDRFLKHTSHPAPEDALIGFIDMYLSPRHRDEPERGCPLPSLSGDVARLPAAARERFATGVARLTGSIAKLLKQIGRPDSEQLAASALSEIVGAVALSRAIGSQGASNAILKATRDAVKTRLGLAR